MRTVNTMEKLSVKQQLKLVREKCPDVWEMIDEEKCPADFNLTNVEGCLSNENNSCTSCWGRALNGGDNQ